MQHIIEHAEDDLNTYNLGTRTTTSVRAIADIVSDELDPIRPMRTRAVIGLDW